MAKKKLKKKLKKKPKKVVQPKFQSAVSVLQNHISNTTDFGDLRTSRYLLAGGSWSKPTPPGLQSFSSLSKNMISPYTTKPIKTIIYNFLLGTCAFIGGILATLLYAVVSG